MPDISAAHTVKITGGDGIQSRRNNTDIIFFCTHPGLPENMIGLFQRADRDSPQLPVFFRFTPLSAFFVNRCPLFQTLCQRKLLQECSQRLRVVCGCGAFRTQLLQMKQRSGQLLSQDVDLCKERFCFFRIFRIVSLRMLAPCGVIFPGILIRAPEIHIRSQCIAFIQGKTGQA